MPVTTINH